MSFEYETTLKTRNMLITRSDRVSPGAFRSLVASLGFKMQPQDEAGYLELLRSAVEAVDHVQALPEYHDPRLMAAVNAGQARTYTRPPASENPLNAWSHRVRRPL